MSKWLIVPPVTFLILVLAGMAVSIVSSRLAAKSSGPSAGKLKSYGCGEDVDCPRVQPDFSQFFPFAFFFTIMHVVALIITTAPAQTIRTSGIAALYVISAVMGLLILFRK